MLYAQQSARQVLQYKYYSPRLVLSHSCGPLTTKKRKMSIAGAAVKFTGMQKISSRRKGEHPHGSAPAPLGISSPSILGGSCPLDDRELSPKGKNSHRPQKREPVLEMRFSGCCYIVSLLNVG